MTLGDFDNGDFFESSLCFHGPGFTERVYLPVLNNLDHYSIMEGQEEMSAHNLMIAGITRDNAKGFSKIKVNIEK